MSRTTSKKNSYFSLKDSAIAGTGGFALRTIPTGTRIIEYVGERISSDEADNRYDDSKMKTHHTFLFSVDDDVTIDAAVNGNEARFINHSCEPNCEAVDEEGRIFIEAIRDIAKGEELTYDYRFTLGDDVDTSNKRLRKRYACRCGAKTCRGTMLDISPKKKVAPKKATKRATTKSRTREARA